MRGAGIQTGKPAAEWPLGVFIKQTVNTKCTEGGSHFVLVQKSCPISSMEPTAGIAMCHFDSQTKAQELGVLALQ